MSSVCCFFSCSNHSIAENVKVENWKNCMAVSRGTKYIHIYICIYENMVSCPMSEQTRAVMCTMLMISILTSASDSPCFSTWGAVIVFEIRIQGEFASSVFNQIIENTCSPKCRDIEIWLTTVHLLLFLVVPIFQSQKA